MYTTDLSDPVDVYGDWVDAAGKTHPIYRFFFLQNEQRTDITKNSLRRPEMALPSVVFRPPALALLGKHVKISIMVMIVTRAENTEGTRAKALWRTTSKTETLGDTIRMPTLRWSGGKIV